MAPPRRSDEDTYRTGRRADGPLCLVVVEHDGVRAHELPARGRLRIGRAPENEIVLDDVSVSRQHAIVDAGDDLVLEDLGSANGTCVRGRRIEPHARVPILVGDAIEIGSVLVAVQRGGGDPDRAPPPRRAPRPGATFRPAPVAPADTSRAPVVADPATARMFELVDRVAQSDISVLLLGETGAGKEIVAEAIHARSKRARAPFLRLHLAALSPTLIEGELFGHDRGAFTGAAGAKPGLLEVAEGGTVLLDEIGELPPVVQVKLLRVLEERMIMRVGALAPRTIDVRFIAATNRDLRAAAAQGAFREDLYFRLNGVSLTVPPLRDRPGDIEPLARAFLARSASNAAGERAAFSAGALALLRAYGWPGNVRELKNVVERAAVLCRGRVIEPEHLPPELAYARAAPSEVVPDAGAADVASSGVLRGEIEALERRRIIEALHACGGNQTRAAEQLGMPRRTLTDKLRLYGIPRPRSR